MDDKSTINLQQAIDNLLDKLENEEITVSQAREVAMLLKEKIAESQAEENQMAPDPIGEVVKPPEKIGIKERVKSWVNSLRLRNRGGKSSDVLDRLISPPAELLPNPAAVTDRFGADDANTMKDAVTTEPSIKPSSPDLEFGQEVLSSDYEVKDFGTSLQRLDRASTGTSADSFWAKSTETDKTMYLKTETDENKLRAELLANSMYRLMGIKVPQVDLVQYQGKLWTASTEIPDCKPSYMGELQSNWEEIAQGFVTDAYLANLDVFGLVSNANVAHNADGFWRLDLGGSLGFIGRHGEKTFSANAVPEIDSMRDDQYTPGKVFEQVPDSAIRQQVSVLAETMSDDVIRKLVERSGISKPDEAIRSLIGRREYLKDRFLSPAGVMEKGEGEKQLDQLSSMKSFPQKTQEVIQSHLDSYHQLQAKVEEFRTRLIANSPRIQELVNGAKKEPEDDGYGFPNYFTSERMELSQYTTELSDLQHALNGNRVPYELDCDEAIDASSHVGDTFNQCAEMLSDNSRCSSQADERKALLRRRIEEENIRINDEYMSHVTGYEPLVDIIRNGRLMSKARQIQVNGQPRLTITSKPGQEMHQIVFDRRKIGPEYSAPEGMAKIPPVVFLVESTTILGDYQGMESDGWHAFGKAHDTTTGHDDDFDEDLTQKRLVVLVPEEYRDQLYQDLQSSYTDRSAIDERLKELNVAFMDKSLYRKPDGSLYGYGDMQQNHGLVQAIYDRAKRELPARRSIRGRLVENGNTGHGSATWDKPLASYVLAS